MGLFDFFSSRWGTKKTLALVKEAQDEMDEILNNNPNLKDAVAERHYEEGSKELQKQNWAGAIENLKLAIRQNPKHAKAQMALSLAFGGVMDFDSARKHYDILKELDPALAERLANSPAGMMILGGGSVIQM